MDPADRGARALVLLKDPILAEALQATNDMVTRMFNSAETAEEAWSARLAGKAVGALQAHLLATIQFGKSEVEKMIRERDKLSDRKKRKESETDYLNAARKAREDFDDKMAVVANN